MAAPGERRSPAAVTTLQRVVSKDDWPGGTFVLVSCAPTTSLERQRAGAGKRIVPVTRWPGQLSPPARVRRRRPRGTCPPRARAEPSSGGGFGDGGRDYRGGIGGHGKRGGDDRISGSAFSVSSALSAAIFVVIFTTNRRTAPTKSAPRRGARAGGGGRAGSFGFRAPGRRGAGRRGRCGFWGGRRCGRWRRA